MNEKFDFMLMRLLRRLGFEKTAWALRRLNCPVGKDALVLEVGSGGNPYFRANVLLDAYENTRERHWVPLISDRPTVLGFVENLPFKDKAFDFVIASHVLEHSADPRKFLSELQRVAKAGYIEVPDTFMERINPYRDHRLEITVRNGRLCIRKKKSWQVDAELVELYESRIKKIITQDTMRKHPFEFHVRYYWQNKIDYEILNPEIDASWQASGSDNSSSVAPNFISRFRSKILEFVRLLFSQHRRNKNIDLIKLLSCPSCKNVDLKFSHDNIFCQKCNKNYIVQNGIPVMYPTSKSNSDSNLAIAESSMTG